MGRPFSQHEVVGDDSVEVVGVDIRICRDIENSYKIINNNKKILIKIIVR